MCAIQNGSKTLFRNSAIIKVKMVLKCSLLKAIKCTFSGTQTHYLLFIFLMRNGFGAKSVGVHIYCILAVIKYFN